MRNFWGYLIGIALGAWLAGVSTPAMARANLPPPDGFVLTGWGEWRVEDAIASVSEAQRVGARHIAIMVQFCQNGLHGSEVHWCNEDGRLPFEATQQGIRIAQVIADIEARGMTFGLLPIIFTGEGQSRSWIWPTDRDAWFKSYGDRIEQLAGFARDHHAASLIVASELTLLFVEDWAWRSVIRRVRSAYSGHITISPVFAQFALISFWDALDSIGLSAYFPLTVTDGRFTDLQFLLNMAWFNYKATLEAFAVTHLKPLMFVEVGYPNTNVAASRPWDYEWPKRTLNTDLPRKCWEAFRANWSHSSMLRSFQIWSLSNPRDDAATPKTFSPIGKPSEDVVRRLFKERAEK